jgi:hypothetical protein
MITLARVLVQAEERNTGFEGITGNLLTLANDMR